MLTSIRSRLVVSHLAVIVLAMGLSGFLLLSLLERYFLESMEDSLVAQAQITARAIMPQAVLEAPASQAPASAFNTIQQRQTGNLSLQAENLAPFPEGSSLDDGDLGRWTDTTLQLSSQLDTRIQILDAQGVVLLDSRQESQSVDLGEDPLVAQALTGSLAARTETRGDAPAMTLAMPVWVEGGLLGVVHLRQPLNDVMAVIGDLRIRWLLSTLIALAFSVLVGLLLSGAIARPVGLLIAAAGAVAQGRLDLQVPIRSRDELGHLGRAFNDMVARLRTAHQMQVDFVANVSHELRTPLTAIKGTVETLRDGAVDDVDVRDGFLATVESETDRMIRLVNDLLILSRADSKALNLSCEPVDLVRLASTTVENLRARAEAGDVGLCVEGRSGRPRAWCDSDRVEQVFVNLLDNAIKYSQPGSVATVRLGEESDGWIEVQICDSGIGIPSHALPRVGERFYRADRSRARTQGGSGLGLAIARTLVEAHGGQLWVKSQAGVGTVVSFTLPSAETK